MYSMVRTRCKTSLVGRVCARAVAVEYMPSERLPPRGQKLSRQDRKDMKLFPVRQQRQAIAADPGDMSRTIHNYPVEQHQTSATFKMAYPHLRCLHLSETPVSRVRTSLPNRQQYRVVPLSWASAGHTECHSVAGIGEDIYYSIWQEDQGRKGTKAPLPRRGQFPRLEELEYTEHYQYAYMFNAPRAYRHTGHVRDKVIVFRSDKIFDRTDKALGAGIFWLYAGYEMDGCAGCDFHLSKGYGLIWNKDIITDWTLVAKRDVGSDWAIM